MTALRILSYMYLLLSTKNPTSQAKSIKPYLHTFVMLNDLTLWLDNYYNQSEFVSLGKTKAIRQSDGSGAIESNEHISSEWGSKNSSLAHMDFEAGTFITPAQSLCFKYDTKSWNWLTNTGSTRGQITFQLSLVLHVNVNIYEWFMMLKERNLASLHLRVKPRGQSVTI